MKHILYVLLSVIIFAFLVSAGGAETGIVKVGVAGPHTGDLASYGIPAMRAMELVTAKYNEAGGLNGNTIELIIEDERCEASEASNVAAKLIGDGVSAVIGHICSSATIAAMGYYKNEDVLAISPSATNPSLTKSGDFPNFFRTISPDDAQAYLQVSYLKSLGNIRRVAILHDKGDYGRGLVEFGQQYIEEDGSMEVVLFEGITPGALDYTAVVLKIAQSQADVVLFGGYHPEASKIVALMATQNLDIPFISGDSIKDPSFIDIAKEAAEGVIATGPMVVKNAALDAVLAEHVREYGEDPGPFFQEAYAAGEALFQAITMAGNTDYNAIHTALMSQQFDTVLGKISFNDQGDIIGAGFSVYEVRDGVFHEKRL